MALWYCDGGSVIIQWSWALALPCNLWSPTARNENVSHLTGSICKSWSPVCWRVRHLNHESCKGSRACCPANDSGWCRGMLKQRNRPEKPCALLMLNNWSRSDEGKKHVQELQAHGAIPLCGQHNLKTVVKANLKAIKLPKFILSTCYRPPPGDVSSFPSSQIHS